ncbi:MAG: uroporphyrinogen-III synthase [Candidatus Polarisedimenticolia bacterium]
MPLAGRTVLVTRAAGQPDELGPALRALGARVLEAPLISFQEPRDWGPADRAIANLAAYRMVLFTSANAVRRFVERLRRNGVDPEVMTGARVVAIGPATAAAAREATGVPVDAVASDFRAEGLLSLLSTGPSLAGWSILLPRAEVAREVLPESLRSLGANVEVVTVYRTEPCALPEDVRTMLRRGEFDAIALTSASMAAGLAAEVGAQAPGGVVVAALGPVTAKAARDAGIEPAVVAPRATVKDLAAAIAAHFDQDGRSS